MFYMAVSKTLKKKQVLLRFVAGTEDGYICTVPITGKLAEHSWGLLRIQCQHGNLTVSSLWNNYAQEHRVEHTTKSFPILKVL